jgi:hypothetical protein
MRWFGVGMRATTLFYLIVVADCQVDLNRGSRPVPEAAGILHAGEGGKNFLGETALAGATGFPPTPQTLHFLQDCLSGSSLNLQ